MPGQGPPRRIRVLVLSADVGEGHIAAARALAQRLRRRGGVDVAERDGLRAFGPLLRHVMRDGYRRQLRWAPWSYDLMYRALTGLRPVRAAGEWALSLAGQRRLRRIIRREAPDVVISTHPALTAVLGRMRLRRRLDTPVCVTVIDFDGYRVWSHRGADRHLVMHADAVAAVEQLAGIGSAALVEPLVAARFLTRRAPSTARARLGLPPAGRVVVVSGGGWGVGDLGGAVETALELEDVTVVALAGRNDDLRTALERRFLGDARVRVSGFTDAMADLLRAADVVLHSTGGMTSIEALSCGCPLIAYGSAIGHIRVHNDALAALGLIRVARTCAELEAALRTVLAGPSATRVLGDGGGEDPAAAVLAVRPRVRPLPGWRIALAHAVPAIACLGAFLAGVSTDDAYSLAARPLELRPTTHIVTTRDEAALIVRARPGVAVRVARALAASGVHASFAYARPPGRALTDRLAAFGDDTLPELAAPGRVAPGRSGPPRRGS